MWRTSAGGERLHVYKWTGKNDYVALCEPEYLSFGGGCVRLSPRPPRSPNNRALALLCSALPYFFCVSCGCRRTGTATTGSTSTTRSSTAPPRAARPSRTSRCARLARTGVARSRSSASASRCGPWARREARGCVLPSGRGSLGRVDAWRGARRTARGCGERARRRRCCCCCCCCCLYALAALVMYRDRGRMPCAGR